MTLTRFDLQNQRIQERIAQALERIAAALERHDAIDETGTFPTLEEAAYVSRNLDPQGHVVKTEGGRFRVVR